MIANTVNAIAGTVILRDRNKVSFASELVGHATQVKFCGYHSYGTACSISTYSAKLLAK